jgi:ankyrin repeat protein
MHIYSLISLFFVGQLAAMDLATTPQKTPVLVNFLAHKCERKNAQTQTSPQTDVKDTAKTRYIAALDVLLAKDLASMEQVTKHEKRVFKSAESLKEISESIKSSVKIRQTLKEAQKKLSQAKFYQKEAQDYGTHHKIDEDWRWQFKPQEQTRALQNRANTNAEAEKCVLKNEEALICKAKDRETLLSLTNNAQLIPSHAILLCVETVENNLIDVAQVLVEKHGADIAAYDKNNSLIRDSIIHYGEKREYESEIRPAVEFLVKNGASVMKRPEKNKLWIHENDGSLARLQRNSTPLHESALFGYNEITTTLLDNGADVNAEGADIDAVYCQPPLYFALMRGNIDTAELLLTRGAKTSILNLFTLCCPRDRAYEYSAQIAVEFLLRHGVNPNEKYTYQKQYSDTLLSRTPLQMLLIPDRLTYDCEVKKIKHDSIVCENYGLVKLLAAYGANINEVFTDPLDRSKEQPNTTFLLQALKDCANHLDEDLALKEKVSIVKLLLSVGADQESSSSPKKSSTFMQSTESMSPIEYWGRICRGSSAPGARSIYSLLTSAGPAATRSELFKEEWASSKPLSDLVAQVLSGQR